MDRFNRDNRKKNPFDFLNDDEFDKIFEEIQKILKNIDFKELVEELIKNGFDPNKRFIHGFSVNIGTDGKPNIQEFGNKSIKSPTGEPFLSDESEPLTDVIEGNEYVAITLEVPGVNKNDINLNITENKLEIKVNNPKRKYYKKIELPCKVKPKTTKATYKNGILDIVIKRSRKKKHGEGFKVNID